MSRPVDEKIVRMSLDNARFKDRVKDTLNSFNTMNKEIGQVSGVELSKMAEGIARIERRFSATGVVIANIITDLTQKAMNFGKRLVGAALDPLMEGGKNRALNIQQAKFQFEGLGMDVEKAMESANAAVSGTAFGLDEAAMVAAQFGASGVEAGEEMTAALLGISGVAAMTGSSYMDIGSVFTTVAGNGRLMSNELLRLSSRGINAAATLADHFGTTEAEIRELVTKGGVSFDMFAEAMSSAFGEHATKANELYSGSLSNVRAALARIGADIHGPSLENKRDVFNALRVTIWGLHEALGPAIEAWNEFHKMTSTNLISFIERIDFTKFSELGGFTNMIETFWNIIHSGSHYMAVFREGFGRVFNPNTTNILVRITEIFRDLSGAFRLNTTTGPKFAKIFEGIFSIIQAVMTIARQLGEVLIGLLPKGLGGGLLDILVTLAEFAIEMNRSVQEGNALTDTIRKIGDGLQTLIGYIKDGIGNVGEFSLSIRDKLGGAISWLRDLLAPVGEWLKEIFGGLGAEHLLGGATLGGGFLVFIKIKTSIERLLKFLNKQRESARLFGDSFKRVLDNLSGALVSMQEQVKYKNLFLIAASVGILAVSLKLLQDLDTEDIVQGIAALVGAMGTLSLGMFAVEKLNFTGGIRASITIIALAIAVSIMAGALKKIADLNPKELMVGIGGLVGVVVALSAAMIAMSTFGGKMKTSSLQLIALATAVLILSKAIKTMSSIESGDLFRSVGAMALIFAQLAIFLKVVDGSKFRVSSALGILIISGAIHVMIMAIKQIADIDVSVLTKGLIVLAVILAQIAIFSRITSGGTMLAAGAGMLIVAGAIRALIKPISELGSMSIEELIKGLGGMAVALLVIAGAATLASGSIGGAVAIMVMAVAMRAIMGPIKTFSNMTWGQIIKGFVGVAGGMTVVALAATLLSFAIAPMMGFGAALLLIGVAMLAAGVGIGLFGGGLMTLAGMTATSIVAIVASLGMLIRSLGEIIIYVVEFAIDLGMALISGISQLGPPLAVAVADLLIALLDTIYQYMDVFLQYGSLIVMEIMKGIGEWVPKIVDTGAKMIIDIIDGMTEAIRENGPVIVDSVMALLGEILLLVIYAGISMIDALFGWIPGVKKATTKIGETAEDYIRKNFGAKETGEDKGSEFATGLDNTENAVSKAVANLAKVGENGLAIDTMTLGENFGGGFASGIEKQSTLSKVVNAAKGMAKRAANAVANWLDMRSPSKLTEQQGEWFGEGLAEGIVNSTKRVSNSAKSLAMSAKESLDRFLDGFMPDDGTIIVKLDFDDEDFDPNDLDPGPIPIPVSMIPDTSMINGLIASVNATMRQNRSKDPTDFYNDLIRVMRDTFDNSEIIEILEEVNQGIKDGSVIVMDSRKVGESVQPYIKQIQDRNDIMKNRAKGLLI